MSTTPAFSPGPCTTNFPRVGNRFKCTLLDLYEQCSLHITEKIPSSVMFGSRPRICFTRAYSSAVRPCSAAISGVTRISVGAVAISLRRGPCCAHERFDHGAKNDQAIARAESQFRGALGMRHQAGDVAFAAADAGDVMHRAIGIAGVIVRAVGRSVPKNHLAILFESCESIFVHVPIPVGVGDGHFENLAS